MANYPIPPWLAQRTDYGALALARSRAQADLNMQSQRIAQQQQQFEQQMEMRRMSMEVEARLKEKQLKMQAEVAKSRLDVEMAYNQVKAGLESSRIQAANRKLDMDYSKLSDQMTRRQQFEDTVLQRIKASGNPEQAFRDTWFEQGGVAGIPYPAGARTAVGKEPFNPTITHLGGHELIQTSPNQYRLAPPKVAVGSSRIEPAGMGFSRIITPGKPDRMIRAPQFKFSGEKELNRLVSGDFAPYLDEKVDISRFNRDFKGQITAARNRYKELLDQREQEMKQFNTIPTPQADEQEMGEEPDGEEGGFDFEFDPDSNSVLPNQ